MNFFFNQVQKHLPILLVTSFFLCFRLVQSCYFSHSGGNLEFCFLLVEMLLSWEPVVISVAVIEAE